LPEPEVLSWAATLCDALTYLHSQAPPITFRDLKPQNVMLRRDGRVALIDFGIAREPRIDAACAICPSAHKPLGCAHH
jgi:serine/threonine protein kinase